MVSAGRLVESISLLACPRCRASLELRDAEPRIAEEIDADPLSAHALGCTACGARYPIRFGIADLRLSPDPWIGIDDEIDKVRRVLARATERGGSFAETVRAYWEETPGTPPAVAARYARGVTRGIARETRWLERVLASDRRDAPAQRGPTTAGTGARAEILLDAGCGSGALSAAAAALGLAAIGIDVALRWLVIARRRFEELGGPPPLLLAASANAIPLRDDLVSAIVGDDLLDHLREPHTALREFRRVLAPGGRLHQTSPNKYSIALEPHARIPALGLLPAHLRAPAARAFRGVDYREVYLLSARDIERLLRDAGFEEIRVEPARLFDSVRGDGAFGRLASLYERLMSSRAGRSLLRAIGPSLEIAARAPRAAPLV
jgi:ubiquinone/menaquinone biosynthesis C-methylase UbiE/uncharacterized protein YbaR (Trm112 family)